MVEHYMEDKEPQRDTDYYYVRARQRDGPMGVEFTDLGRKSVNQVLK